MNILEEFKKKNLVYTNNLNKYVEENKDIIKVFNEKFKDLNKKKKELDEEEIGLSNKRRDKLTSLCVRKTDLIKTYYKEVRKIGHTIWLEKNGENQFTLTEDKVKQFFEGTMGLDKIELCERVYTDIAVTVFRVAMKLKKDSKVKRVFKNYYLAEIKVPWSMYLDVLKDVERDYGVISINCYGLGNKVFYLFPRVVGSTSIEGLNRKWKKFKKVLEEICFCIYRYSMELKLIFQVINENDKNRIIEELMEYEEIREAVNSI